MQTKSNKRSELLPNYTFTEKVLIKNMTKYEKAINGKQTNKEY